MWKYPLPKWASPTAHGWPSSTPTPVSYTHLDVYKRQGGQGYHPGLGIVGMQDVGPQRTQRPDEVDDCLLYTSRCV